MVNFYLAVGVTNKYIYIVLNALGGARSVCGGGEMQNRI